MLAERRGNARPDTRLQRSGAAGGTNVARGSSNSLQAVRRSGPAARLHMEAAAMDQPKGLLNGAPMQQTKQQRGGAAEGGEGGGARGGNERRCNNTASWSALPRNPSGAAGGHRSPRAVRNRNHSVRTTARIHPRAGAPGVVVARPRCHWGSLAQWVRQEPDLPSVPLSSLLPTSALALAARPSRVRRSSWRPLPAFPSFRAGARSCALWLCESPDCARVTFSIAKVRCVVTRCRRSGFAVLLHASRGVSKELECDALVERF